MQKFVTIFLSEKRPKNTHALIQEHLSQYLNDGWTIAQITGVGGVAGDNRGGFLAAGWIAVVLQKP